jgi:hypothetical protein
MRGLRDLFADLVDLSNVYINFSIWNVYIESCHVFLFRDVTDTTPAPEASR